MSEPMSAQLEPAVITPIDLGSAYRCCREIARREAKNFYYAFLALPPAKHNAICAVYAFMRHADDLSDDESISRAARRQKLEAWMQDWREVAAAPEPNRVSADPVFIALADARKRFHISLRLLEQLVEGTAMDLDPARDHAAGTLDTYATFDDLYCYCYLVASVVGLVCIRIFEYSDPTAEKLAEELGVAFQLTNILRDVREDAERGRVYLPVEDIKAHGLSINTLSQAALTASFPAGKPSPQIRALLAAEAARAEHYYLSGQKLLPMIAPDSRPALWVLMTIYHRLLRRIERANYDVFSARISVPAWQKLAILAVGLLRIARHRLFGSRSA
jgi:phytoene synthase